MRYVKYEVVPINGIMLKKSFVILEKGQFKVKVKLEGKNIYISWTRHIS